jgi:leucyl-tRNA synthetase
MPIFNETLVVQDLDYEPKIIEASWRQAWAEAGCFRTPDHTDGRVDSAVQVSCPFTSGAAHMGHVRSYTIADAHARFRRARGEAVLFSLGFDAFGLPAEIGAIEHEMAPREWVERCAAEMRSQFEQLGFSFDWERAFLSCDEDVYRWSQWLFVTLLERGLVYEREGVVDWCDGCGTVLARLQVEDGCCWRCHNDVRLVQRKQWYLRSSAYHPENYRRLDGLTGWNHRSIEGQRTLLGRETGVEFDAGALDGTKLTIFTPFPDSIPDGRFVLISPNHPDCDYWLQHVDTQRHLSDFREGARSAETLVVDTTIAVHVPGIAGLLPVLAAPSVDEQFGSTAVLGIPDRDPRHAAIIVEQQGSGSVIWRLQEKPLVTRQAERYRAGDFPISRQRAWGAPIPIVRCDGCGAVPVPVEQLPVCLPVDLMMRSDGNVLAHREDFVSCQCPRCGAPARRETDTLDCHVDAAWQEMPLAVPPSDRAQAMFDHPEMERWFPVAQYVHGADIGGFILDERSVAKALRDHGACRFLGDGEPFTGAFMHEMVHFDGRKMSKHLGNVVSPQDLVDRFGADVVRLAVLHAASPEKVITWSDGVLAECDTFIRDLWEYARPRLSLLAEEGASATPDTSDPLRRRLVSWCETARWKMTENLEALAMHRATRNVMILLRRIQDFEGRVVDKRGELSDADAAALGFALLTLVRLLAPLTPHSAEELWMCAGADGLVAQAPWPGKE